MKFPRLSGNQATVQNCLNAAAAGAILLLAAGALAQAATSRSSTGRAPTAQTFQVVCTMGTASIVQISAGACASDAEHDEGGGGDPVQDNDGPSGDTVNNGSGDNNNIVSDANATSTSSCGFNTSQQVANCYPSPTGPATGNPRQGSGPSPSGSVSSSTWLAACTKTFAKAEADCNKAPNHGACLTQAKDADKTCIMAASANAAQHGDRLPPDPSAQMLTKADCATAHSKNAQYCSSMTSAVKGVCLTKASLADRLCAAAVHS